MINETESQKRILLARRFPAHAHRILMGIVKASEAVSLDDAKAIDSARSELAGLPDTELRRRYRSEVDQIRAEGHWLSQCLDQWAPPDYDHWATMPLWSMDETALLLLDRDPEAVKVPLEETTLTSKDHREFERLRDKLERAVSSGQLYRRTEPATVLSWVLARGMPVPDRLERAVREKTEFVDWQAVAQTEREQHAAETAELRRRIDELERALKATVAERPLNPQSARTEAILLFAAASTRPYTFKPGEPRNPGTVKHFQDALALVGIAMDDGTVLDTLRRVAEVGKEAAKRAKLKIRSSFNAD
jgi:hypothetical protein